MAEEREDAGGVEGENEKATDKAPSPEHAVSGDWNLKRKRS